jgi:hypothetical protein
MGVLTSTQMQAELAVRVTQIPTGASSRAEAAINRAIKWANRQGAYTFQLSAPVNITPSTTSGVTSIATPTDFDPGKAMVLLNVTGTPIQRAAITEIGASLNYNTIASTDYDQYYLAASSAGASRIYLYPSNAISADVTMVYHKITTDITGSQVSNLPRDFDDLLIDLAEAEERRIFDVGDAWPQLLERSQSQVKLLLEAYRSAIGIQGLVSEAVGEVQAKTQVGHP